MTIDDRGGRGRLEECSAARAIDSVFIRLITVQNDQCLRASSVGSEPFYGTFLKKCGFSFCLSSQNLERAKNEVKTSQSSARVVLPFKFANETLNPFSLNSDLSQIPHCSIKGRT